MSHQLGHIKRRRNIARRQRRHLVERINRTHAVAYKWRTPLELNHSGTIHVDYVASFGGYVGMDGRFHVHGKQK